MDIKELCNYVNPFIGAALRAASKAIETMNDEDIIEFQKLCRPAEYILLVRRSVDLELVRRSVDLEMSALNTTMNGHEV